MGKSDTVGVVVSAHTLLRDLLLQADRLDPRAAADQGLRTPLPGEQARFRATGCGSAYAMRAREALLCVDAMRAREALCCVDAMRAPAALCSVDAR